MAGALPSRRRDKDFSGPYQEIYLFRMVRYIPALECSMVHTCSVASQNCYLLFNTFNCHTQAI